MSIQVGLAEILDPTVRKNEVIRQEILDGKITNEGQLRVRFAQAHGLSETSLMFLGVGGDFSLYWKNLLQVLDARLEAALRRKIQTGGFLSTAQLRQVSVSDQGLLARVRSLGFLTSGQMEAVERDLRAGVK